MNDLILENSRLMYGDCLERMKEIPNGSIDMILCDLPYGVLNKSNKHVYWDNIIPFEELWKAYNRIIRDNGVIVLFSQGLFTANLMLSNSKMWRYNLVWDKVLKSGFLNSRRQPLRQHEDIVVFAKGSILYNPQMVKCEAHKRNHSKGNMKVRSTNRCYGDFKDTQTIISDEKFPTSIICIPKEHVKGKSYHPTQKPVALMEYLIRTYTNENMTVLDNCMGSGSTGVACINTNRKFIGIELDEKYYDNALNRLQNHIKQLSLF